MKIVRLSMIYKCEAWKLNVTKKKTLKIWIKKSRKLYLDKKEDKT